jgi:LPXTG-motif cell wall-anchored protein
MRTSIRAAVALLTICTLVGFGGAVASAGQGGQGGNEDNITICHRTNSNANPYVIITTDASGQNGGTDHLHEHQGPVWDPTLKKQKIEWGDVIPPPPGQTEGSQAYEQLEDQQAGEGQAYIDRGCHAAEPPVVPTHSVTLDKVTEGETAPVASTEFTFTVECESGDVPESPVSIAPEDDPLTVATGVAEDDLCTITETNSNGADDISFAVTGGTEDSHTDTSVTVAAGADTAVVATNGYGEVLGEVITPTPKPTPKPAPAVEAAALPTTGASDMTPYYAMAGAALLLLGAMARLASRKLLIDSES